MSNMENKVVRTYPDGFDNPTQCLENAFKEGWTVVMSNPFTLGGHKEGIEYILQRPREKRETKKAFVQVPTYKANYSQ